MIHFQNPVLSIGTHPQRCARSFCAISAVVSRQPLPTLMGSTPGPTTAAPAPSAVPVVTVFNGGNLRVAPELQAAVLDQIHAGETVALLGRSADGQWLQVRDMRGPMGWVHRTLLTLEPGVDAALPAIAP